MNLKKNQHHWGIFVNNHSDKQGFLGQLLSGPLPERFSGLHGKRGALFSKLALDRFMEEEERHDDNSLTRNGGQRLQTMSSGERKKALLAYLLDQNPDFLVLDNPFDNLDSNAQEALRSRLERLVTEIPMIQLISRTTDLLPFIDHFAFLQEKHLIFFDSLNELQARLQKSSRFLEAAIPEPPEPLEYDGNILVELKKVSVSYSGKAVLQDIYWRIQRGEFWQLTGSNGSGKTTLLSMITGDNPKGYGQELYLFGQRKGSGESVWDIKKKLGYFTPSMIDRFRGYHSLENMLISGLTDSIGLYVRPTEAQVRIAGAWLGLLGLQPQRQTYFHELTTGQQRLVMCARAMVKHPLLLILDEPTAGLDDASAALFVALVNKFAKESRTAIIFVSHRDEPGLDPEAIYQLEMGPEGSSGKALYKA